MEIHQQYKHVCCLIENPTKQQTTGQSYPSSELQKSIDFVPQQTNKNTSERTVQWSTDTWLALMASCRAKQVASISGLGGDELLPRNFHGWNQKKDHFLQGNFIFQSIRFQVPCQFSSFRGGKAYYLLLSIVVTI